MDLYAHHMLEQINGNLSRIADALERMARPDVRVEHEISIVADVAPSERPGSPDGEVV